MRKNGIVKEENGKVKEENQKFKGNKDGKKLRTFFFLHAWSSRKAQDS